MLAAAAVARAKVAGAGHGDEAIADLDRAFFDFGETEILEAYWAAMHESYAIVTDQATGAWVTAIFACVGGVQVAYAAFKAVGVTDKWLDALLAMGTPKKDN